MAPHTERRMTFAGLVRPAKGMKESLLSVAIVERDTNGDSMVVWSYPMTDEDMNRSIVKRSGVLAGVEAGGRGAGGDWESEVWYRREKLNSWVYVFAMDAKDGDALPEVARIGVAISASDFYPEKYLRLARVFADVYEGSANPVRVLEGFLSVLTVGKFAGRVPPVFDVSEYDAESATRNAPISQVAKALGRDVAILWAAILLKKRVLVYSNDVPHLLGILRALPAMVWTRQDWSILRSLNFDEEDMSELGKLGVYIAGTTLPSEDRTDLYDVYADLDKGTVVVAEGARSELGFTSVHKDVATFLVSAAEKDQPAYETIQGLSDKTTDVVNKLRLLAEQEQGGKIGLASLKQQLPNAALAHFLFGAAVAEGLAAETDGGGGDEQEEVAPEE